ncbi:MAG: Ycf48-like protein [Ignavibacteriaceae bacterium]|nr:Ycf48-like protein [Ignavibacteriaceae bacterium]
MKKLLCLWLFVSVTLSAQFSSQALNPNPYYGRIKAVSHPSDSVLYFAAELNGVVSIYKHNPMVPGEPVRKLREIGSGLPVLINQMNFNSSGFGFVVTATFASSYTYYLWMTTDGGITWIQRLLNDDFDRLEMKSPEEGIYVSLSGKISKTTNGGNTWSALSSPGLSGRFIRDIAYSANGLMTAVTTDTILCSKDGGDTWDFIQSFAPDNWIVKAQNRLSSVNAVLTEKGNIVNIILTGGTGGMYTTSTLNTGITAITRSDLGEQNIILFSDTKDSLYLFSSEGVQNRYPAQNISYLYSGGSARFAFVYFENTIRLTESGILNLRNFNGRINNIYHLDFFNASVGYSAGYNTPALKTTDGGKTWSEIFGGVSGYVSTRVQTISENHVIMHFQQSGSGSGKSFLVATNNGGMSWQDITNPDHFNVRAFQFLTPLLGYAVGDNGILFITQDGGNNWSVLSHITDGSPLLLYFFDRTHGWAQIGAKLMRTTNGGVSWDSTASSYCMKLAFVTPQIGFGVFGFSESSIFKTTDGGTTWSYSPSFRESDVLPVDENIVYKADVYGQVKYSTNGGSTWAEILTTPAAFGNKLDLINKKTIISYYSQNNTVFRISNSAGNIISIPEMYALNEDTLEIPVQLIIPPGRKYQSVQFNISGYTDKLTFIDAGFSNTLLSGSDWLHSINPASNTIRFAASAPVSMSESGTLVKLRFRVNSALNEYIPLNFSSVLFNTGLVPTDTLNGWVKIQQVNLGDVDLNGSVQAYDASLVLQHITLPGGLPLSPLQKRNANVTTDNTISALDASVILRFITGIVTSLPYGGSGAAAGAANMTNIQAIPGQTVDIPLQLANGNNIYSFEGNFAYDENLLEFTSLQWPAAVVSFVKEFKHSDGRIYIAAAGVNKLDNLQGAQIAVLRFRVKPGAATALTEVTLEKLRLNENPVMLNSASSVISITTGIENGSDSPVEYTLSQNYPNPFNPSTTISFTLPQEGRAVLDLYDIMGKHIAVLLDEYRQAGYHYYTLNTSEITGLTSGIYFYRLRSGAFTDTRKLILLK